VTSGIPVFLTIAGKKWIPAKIHQTGRQLHGLDLDVLCFRGIYFAIHAPDGGKGEIPLTVNLPQLPYTSFNLIRFRGKIAGYTHPADVLRIILALARLHPRTPSQD
jgi:hypothetical protein